MNAWGVGSLEILEHDTGKMDQEKMLDFYIKIWNLFCKLCIGHRS